MSRLLSSKIQWIRRLPEISGTNQLSRLALEEEHLVAEDRTLSDRRRALRKRLAEIQREADDIARTEWSEEDIRAAKEQT